jgi:hypothetical protein
MTKLSGDFSKASATPFSGKDFFRKRTYFFHSQGQKNFRFRHIAFTQG